MFISVLASADDRVELLIAFIWITLLVLFYSTRFTRFTRRFRLRSRVLGLERHLSCHQEGLLNIDTDFDREQYLSGSVDNRSDILYWRIRSPYTSSGVQRDGFQFCQDSPLRINTSFPGSSVSVFGLTETIISTVEIPRPIIHRLFVFKSIHSVGNIGTYFSLSISLPSYQSSNKEIKELIQRKKPIRSYYQLLEIL